MDRALQGVARGMGSGWGQGSGVEVGVGGGHCTSTHGKAKKWVVLCGGTDLGDGG